jgi:hypothetical protein
VGSVSRKLGNFGNLGNLANWANWANFGKEDTAELCFLGGHANYRQAFDRTFDGYSQMPGAPAVMSLRFLLALRQRQQPSFRVLFE